MNANKTPDASGRQAQRTGFSFLEHTTDIRMRAAGETLEELFLACLKGMNESLRAGFCDSAQKGDVSRNIHIHSDDTTVLLIDFLSEVLTLTHIEGCLFCELDIQTMSENELKGMVTGTPVDYFDRDVKAVTYHEAEVRLDERGVYETLVIMDV